MLVISAQRRIENCRQAESSKRQTEYTIIVLTAAGARNLCRGEPVGTAYGEISGP
jgi:hypothetical protein